MSFFSDDREYAEIADVRQPTSFAELEGLEVKIAEKYRISSLPSKKYKVELLCMTLKDINKLDKFNYPFHTEHQVLQNLDIEAMKESSS